MFEGCSHGFWKSNLGSWTGYSPGQTVGSVFTIPPSLSGLADDTLLTALDYEGEETVEGAAKILLRNAIASILNANHPDVDYPLTTAQVISQVNAALASLNRDTMLALEAQLDEYNNSTCDVKTPTPTAAVLAASVTPQSAQGLPSTGGTPATSPSDFYWLVIDFLLITASSAFAAYWWLRRRAP